MEAALDFYTGGNPPSTKHERFDKLRKRLKESGNTGFEFLHYVIHYHNLQKSPAWAFLHRRNLLTSAKCWNAFEKWKSERFDAVCCSAKLQYRMAKSYANMGRDRTRILTENFLDANGITRIDLALFWKGQKEDVDVEKVIDEYEAPAIELALGAPEWLSVAPNFAEYAKACYEEDKEVVEWRLLYCMMMTKVEM